ncbi:MAG: hypothetical protein A2Y62_20395 [Candidatus Fischerbacteria bacterium RBG_13_37_8]|uniref:DUF86 domain-containing protein n=1 Tax=Candidatus Fischerbacteria bacterium RBG_13_37_8 TaxID=1817863 RepID=A0A1F5VXF7_9BACT|nr:MAG: hypothetical protein A2Y62_20395 [Candidatus Fischerbacteria bacterium RBG_13_37_8]
MAKHLIDKDLVLSKISTIRSNLRRLSDMTNKSESEFISDYISVSASERLLQVAIEAFLDIGHHIIAKKGFDRPAEYRDIMIILGKEGVIPPEFAEKVKVMASFRNRLVHLYDKISEKELYSILKNHLKDIENFITYIVSYLEL